MGQPLSNGVKLFKKVLGLLVPGGAPAAQKFALRAQVTEPPVGLCRPDDGYRTAGEKGRQLVPEPSELGGLDFHDTLFSHHICHISPDGDLLFIGKGIAAVFQHPVHRFFSQGTDALSTGETVCGQQPASFCKKRRIQHPALSY